MDQHAIDTFSVSRHAIDLRADGARRDILITRSSVTIDRVFQGIRMRVGVPTAAYRRLDIAARFPSGGATLILRHDDADLDVVLAQGDGIEVARKAKAWSVFLGKEILIEAASIRMGEAIARRTTPPRRKRRSTFAQRRKVGVVAYIGTSFSNEHEIIARS